MEICASTSEVCRPSRTVDCTLCCTNQKPPASMRAKGINDQINARVAKRILIIVGPVECRFHPTELRTRCTRVHFRQPRSSFGRSPQSCAKPRSHICPEEPAEARSVRKHP